MSIATRWKTNKSIREAHSPGVIDFSSEFLHQAVPNPSYVKKTPSGQDFLVLRKYSEALRVNGQVMTDAVGTHAGGLAKGDRMFVVATNEGELYALGAIEVQRSGKDWAKGESLFGAFRIIPLKSQKWQLRFEATSSPRLTRDTAIAMQVRARRQLSLDSSALLSEVLSAAKQAQHRIAVQEGKTRLVTLSTRERDRTLRVLALAERKAICQLCGFDFAETYGVFAMNCVEVHHIEGLAGAGKRGVTTTLDDVLVVCPNCHRALHQYKNPNDWKAFKRACRLV